MKAEIELTPEMKKDREYCGEDSDCSECSCVIGKDDCIYNYIKEKDKDGD